MSHATAHIAEALRSAREAAGLSQRELAQRTGVPQPHISKIENNAVDLRVSSLIAIASALDLDLTLVPRNAVPAVRSIAKMAAPSERSDPQASTELARALQALARIGDPGKADRHATELRAQLEDLARLPLTAGDTGTLHEIRRALETIRDGEKGIDVLDRTITLAKRLRMSRDRIDNAPPSPPRPAYTLDEDDDG